MAMMAPETTPTAPAVLYSPDWWLKRLLGKLVDRAAGCNAYQAYYEGNQPLAFASHKFQEAFGRRYQSLPANFMPLVVEAEKERLIVQGFRFRNRPSGDRQTWDIWQENQLDAESQIAHEIALVKGVAYTLVAPPMMGSSTPLITIEDPSETILETAPGNRRIRLAALKVWLDDDGYSRAYLYLPDEIYRWRSSSRRTDETYTSLSQTPWTPYVDADSPDWPMVNEIGVVPVIPLLNRPRRDGTGRSEIEPVIGNQSAINFLRFSALVGSDTAALPQRWAKNLDLDPDPDTGQVQQPFKSGVDTIWASRRPGPDEVAEYGGTYPYPEFGQFPAANLQPFVDMIHAEIGQMASISRTPYYYLLDEPTSVPPTGESIKSSEAPLVKKIVAESVFLGEGWEETMRVALLAAGQTSKARTDGETIWADPETRNEAARTDSILKQYAAGLLPDEVALEELGYSQQQIERIKSMKTPQPDMPAVIAPPRQKVI